jgi:hypothetical protein
MKNSFQPVTYRLTNNRFGEAVLIKAGRNKKLYIFDEDKGYNRVLRHCPSEKSIFLDEQGEKAPVMAVVFTHGQLEITKSSELITKQFLDAHPDNAANGGNWFIEIDETEEDEAFIEEEELRIELKELVRKTAKEEEGVYDLQAAVSVLEGRYVGNEMPVSEMKARLYSKIDENLNYFLDDHKNIVLFEDSFVKMKHLALRAISEDIIEKDARTRTVRWTKEKDIIYSAPAGTILMDAFSEYLMTDEGMLVGQEIAKRS